MAAPVVGVVGMQAIRKDLNRMTQDVRSPLYDALKRAGYAAVKEIVPTARARMSSRSGRLANSVRASGYGSGAAVRMGSAAVPYAGWVDFGGSRPDGSAREYLAGGRYLFPAAQSLASKAAASYTASITQLFDKPAIWTNSGDNPGSVHD